MRVLLFDLEANGLENVTKVWCIVVKEMITGKVLRFYDNYPGMEWEENDHPLRYAKPVFEKADVIIGHNIIGYDIDLLIGLLGIDLSKTKKIIDTLVWSQTSNPDRKMPKGCKAKGPHSVGAWGYRLGHLKPEHDEWDVFSPEMLHRCTEDVAIQEEILEVLLKETNQTFDDILEFEHEV